MCASDAFLLLYILFCLPLLFGAIISPFERK